MKAPAFRFYPDNWLGGTMGMSFEEQGAYLNLLILQNQKGPFTEIQARKLLGQNHDRLWESLKEKFQKNPAGNFFNERLVAEQEKNKTFSKLQKERVDKRWNKSGIDPVSVGYQSGNTCNEIEIDNEIKNDSFEKSEKLLNPNGETSMPLEMLKIWIEAKPSYAVDRLKDLPALQGIKEFIVQQANKTRGDPHFHTIVDLEILDLWQHLIREFLKDKFWCNKSLSSFGNSIQEFWNKANKNGNKADSQKRNYDKLEELLGVRGQARPHAN